MKANWERIMAALNRQYVLTLILVLWSVGASTFVIVQVFRDITLINMAVNTAFATFFSLPALAFGLAKWRSNRKPNDVPAGKTDGGEAK